LGQYIEEQMDKRISNAFDAVEEDLSDIKKSIDRLEHGQNSMLAKLDIIIETITGLGDLPEE
jgi:uncharacterized protein YoxC